jgi:hypothetical protein
MHWLLALHIQVHLRVKVHVFLVMSMVINILLETLNMSTTKGTNIWMYRLDLLLLHLLIRHE